MKKKFFALLMVMVLVLGMATNVSADVINSPTGNNSPTINSPTGDNTPTKKLDAPKMNVSKDGVITIEAVEGAEDYIFAIDYRMLDNSQGMFSFTTLVAEDFTNGVYEYDLGKAVAEMDGGYWANFENDFSIGVCARNKELGAGKASNAVWKYRFTVDQAKDKLDEALDSENPEVAKNVLSGMSSETVTNLMKEDITKIEKADEAWAEEKNITVEAKSEVTIVDPSKVVIVGAALNADTNEKVVLSVKEPESKVEVDKKYENAIALDIELLVAGTAKEDLSIPVAITMPIPAGVAKENLVILHYHGDATEPEVLVPTVNADGTMTFIVDGFSTFVVANQAAEETGNSGNSGTPVTPDAPQTDEEAEKPNAPQTGDASTASVAWSLLFLVAGVVLVAKRNSFAK